jgi:uroporphyrinogen III methyltransferase/synthase
VTSFPLIELKPLDFELPAPEGFDAVIFTSQNAVSLFCARLHAENLDSRYFGGKRLYSIGPKTTAALAAQGLRVDGQAGEYRAEGLVSMLAEHAIRGQRFLLPRAESARPYLSQALSERGALVNEIKLYATTRPSAASGASLVEALAKVDTVVFTSPSGARQAAELLDDLETLRSMTIAAIGPVTAAELTRLGIPATITAEVYTDEGLIAALSRQAATNALR